MHTIQLKISEKVYDKVIWLLSKFEKEDVSIIENGAEDVAVQTYLNKELLEVKEDRAKFYTQAEFENMMDKL